MSWGHIPRSLLMLGSTISVGCVITSVQNGRLRDWRTHCPVPLPINVEVYVTARQKQGGFTQCSDYDHRSFEVAYGTRNPVSDCVLVRRVSFSPLPTSHADERSEPNQVSIVCRRSGTRNSYAVLLLNGAFFVGHAGYRANLATSKTPSSL
jgi:hypothetical protein